MELVIESLNEVRLTVMTNAGEYEMTFSVDQEAAEKPTLQFAKDDIKKSISINMPFSGMVLKKQPDRMKG